MTYFDILKSMDIHQFAEWLDENCRFDDSPWIAWWDAKYCKNCEPIMCCYKGSNREFPCSWCEIEHNCKFFQNIDEVPNNKEIIKMWLESEVKAKEKYVLNEDYYNGENDGV